MRVSFLIGILWALGGLFAHASVLRIEVKGSQEEVVKLYRANGEELSLTPDKTGLLSWSFDNEQPMYVKVNCKYATYTFWMPASADLSVVIDANTTPASLSSIKGTAQAVNEYLNARPYQTTEINDTSLPEEAFMKKTDSLFRVNEAVLQKAATELPNEFKQMEHQRMFYYSYRTLPIYPQYHRRLTGNEAYTPSTSFWSRLDELIRIEEDCMEVEEYRTFVYDALRQKAQFLFPTLRGEERLTAFLEQEQPAAPLAELLVYRSQLNFLNQGNPSDGNPYEALFARYVKREAWVNEVNTILADFQEIAVGKLSPDFVCTNLAGDTVHLSAFRGRYVYIDLWATWCAPCIKEIPHLARLEEALGDKGIYFVSISCDANRAAWAARVKKGDLKGVQLHFPPNNDFLLKYKVNGIPRFILLDKEGRILSADMSRPSMPETRRQLEALLAE